MGRLFWLVPEAGLPSNRRLSPDFPSGFRPIFCQRPGARISHPEQKTPFPAPGLAKKPGPGAHISHTEQKTPFLAPGPFQESLSPVRDVVLVRCCAVVLPKPSLRSSLPAEAGPLPLTWPRVATGFLQHHCTTAQPSTRRSDRQKAGQ